ncbi:MAG TPA: wax ester/triacylglycerol synthase domain-containing protein [Solirubrobacteraceae bacterium]
MDDLIPLGPEDRAILALESATVAGHTCKVVRLAGPAPEIELLRARVRERLELAPMLTRRLGGSEREPAWVPDPGFDVTAHVGRAPAQAPVDHAGLLSLVSRLFERRLDRERPLWRMDLVDLDDGGSALIWRIHHSLADGTASVRYARALLWDEDPLARTNRAGALAAHAGDEARRRSHLAGFLSREYARGERGSPFDGRIGTRREVAFAAVSLAALHDAARALDGATVNDAVLTIVAGGVARWVRARHGDLGTLRVRVPVSLHHEGDTAANHDSFFAVGVPLGEPDPVARLRDVHRETSARKTAHDAQYHDELMRELSGAPPLRHLLARLERSPRRFALSVSNVPGPPAPVSVLGTPVVHLHSIAEIGERHALRVCALSLAGLLCLGLCADPDVVDRLDLLAEGIAAEAQALLSAAGVNQASAWPT